MNVYMLIIPDEDGNPVRVLGQLGLAMLLEDSRASYGVTEFKDLEWFEQNTDSNYWPEGTGVLLHAEVIVPKAVTKQWSL